MISSLFLRPVLLALGLACAAGAQSARSLSVIPNPAPAEKPFHLYLQGVAADCYTAFSRESVTVSGSRIDLRYTQLQIATTQAVAPVPNCPIFAVDPDGQYVQSEMPIFAMPALKPGKYEVWATHMPECLYSAPTVCKIAVRPESVGVLEVRPETPPEFFLNPAAAPEGKAFEMQLLSYAFTCATTYENLQVTVSDSVIVLSLLDKINPAGICPAIYKPYGPTYKMPALKAGAYRVKVNRLQMSASADAGTLLITGATTRKTWYLKERTVAADKEFQMQLLRDDIGNCQTAFSEQRVAVTTAGIVASFLMESHPERVCVMDMRPHGPIFKMPALKAGVYPVIPYQMAACEALPEPCLLDRVIPATPTDTLIVTQSLAIPISRLREAAPRVELRGDEAMFALPEGKAGSWHAELAAPDGRVLDEAWVGGSAGDRVTVNVGRAPRHGVSLLRLTGPDGSQRLLPIVR